MTVRFPQPSKDQYPPVRWHHAGLEHYAIHAFSDYTAEFLSRYQIHGKPFLSKMSLCGAINLHSTHAGQALGEQEPAEGKVCKRCLKKVRGR